MCSWHLFERGNFAWADEGSRLILLAREVAPGLYEEFWVFPGILLSHEVDSVPFPSSDQLH